MVDVLIWEFCGLSSSKSNGLLVDFLSAIYFDRFCASTMRLFIHFLRCMNPMSSLRIAMIKENKVKLHEKNDTYNPVDEP